MMPVFGFSLGAGELVLLLAIVLVLFGAGRLPAAIQALGSSVKKLRDTSADEGSEARPGEPG